jgi:hypothetical protein
VGAALYEASKILGNERFNKIHNLTNQHIGLVIDTTKELKSYDEDEIKKFELIRLTIGCHLAFAFLITGLILELDVLPANFIYFFSAILAGMAIPYLLFRQKIK